MILQGIDLEKPIRYLAASLRFFKEGEHHITRFCEDDVLLLVYDGVLRFSENGEQYEVSAGEYFIQRHGMYQGGERASDKPKYLYVHMLSEHWAEAGKILPRCGTFDYSVLKANIEEMDRFAHGDAPYIAKAGKLYNILNSLYSKKPEKTLATEISDYIAKNCSEKITLDALCKEFHFSKNHIINIFKKTYGITPITYLQQQRLRKSEYLTETTSDTLESISEASGFNSYAYFYKQFVRKNGISPEKWRENKRLIG